MWPLAAILGAAIGGGVFLCVTGILVTVSVQRHRHRQVLQAHGLSRGLSRYHRSKLSATDNNYVHVTPPNASLRDSSCLPADADWVQSQVKDRRQHYHQRTRSHWSIKPKGSLVDHQTSDISVLKSPKKRQHKKIKKQLSMGKIHQQSLPVIEEAVPQTRMTSSNSAFVAELSGESPTSRPPQELDSQIKPDSSAGWPLTSALSVGATPPPTEVFSRVARPSVIRRIGGLHHLVTRDLPNVEAEPPVTSDEGRTIHPSATWGPPSMTTSNHGEKEFVAPTTRANSSFDTLNSSLLTVVLSPSTVTQSADHTSLSDFEFDLERKRSAASLNMAMCKQMPLRTGVGIRTAKSSVRSLHPTLDVVEQTLDNPSPDHRDQYLPPTMPQTSFSKRSRVEYWTDVDAAETPRWHFNGLDKQRHSMLEASELQDLRRISESMASPGVKSHSLRPLRPLTQRPASIVITNPLQWQKQDHFPAVDCHQSCPNPVGDGLPQADERSTEMASVLHSILMDEDNDNGSLRGNGDVNRYEYGNPRPFPPSMLLGNATGPAKDNSLSQLQTRSPSDVHSTLTPSVHSSHAIPSSENSGTPRPDSDIFSAAYVNMNMDVSRDHRGDTCQWYRSPQQSTKREPTSTPPSSHYPERFESPILSSPALQTSALYPRKVREGREVNISHTTSEGSPVQSRADGQYRIPEGVRADSASARRQGRAIRTMRSERNLVDMTATRTSQHIALSTGRHNTELTDHMSPPVNKRISGLRASSSNSSINTISPHIMSRPRGKASSTRRVRLNEDRSRMAQANRMRSAHHTDRASPSIPPHSGVSIWEDVSIGNHSPEIDVSTPPPLRITSRSGSGSGSRRSPHNRPMYLNNVTQRDEGFRHGPQRQPFPRQHPQPSKQSVKDFPHEYEEMGSSVLVQRLERAVSDGRWDDELHSHQEVEPTTRNIGFGLGISNGNIRIGEPQSYRRHVVYK
ncbi:hypothetical protein PV10_04291 [Exophiala mesophila]|uniref:Uncharacterized protein n=1 Tax=Exophiala mesophila TaxID=212818 RepID=A0A0D1XXX0_EXOME|nr:uncharacterized protein PV10_04291 [Exophiala mesophila]KIV93046.1 hypothetical protein PV10_04291 [Exophiala mesophila]